MNYSLTSSLDVVDPEMADLLAREQTRQQRSIHLLAPSMLVSRAISECVSSNLSNLDGEGYVASPGQIPAEISQYELLYRHAGPQKFNPVGPVAEYIETLAARRLATLFGAGTGIAASDLHVNVHPASGSLANLAVFRGLLRPGDRVVALSPTSGGHLSHGTPIHMTGMEYDIRQIAFDVDTTSISPGEVAEAARAHRADLVILGASSFPRRIAWQEIAVALSELDPRPLLVADVAHFAGLIPAGAYDNPLPWADVVTMVGYKTLGGPKSGVIISRSLDVGKGIARALFPGLQGAPRMAEVAGLATAAHVAASDAYRSMILRAVDMATALDREFRSLGRHPAFGGTDTHMLVLHQITGAVQAVRQLERVGILVNANMVPGDRNPSAASGIRLGTVALAQSGISAEYAPELARLVHDAIDASEEALPDIISRMIRFPH